MKTRKSILVGAFAAAVFIGTTVFLMQRPHPLESTSDAVESAEEAELSPMEALQDSEGSPTGKSAIRQAGKPAPRASAVVAPSEAVMDLPEAAHEPANALRVPAEVVLATVNEKEIQLKDLIPIEAHEKEKMMTPEEYASRLNRAIEMELTFQAAAAQGIGLTAEQSRRLDSIIQKHHATFQEYQKQGITWSSLTAGQVEFEQRLTAALILQQNLVAGEARVAPSPDAAIQTRHEQAVREMLDRLKGSASISLKL